MAPLKGALILKVIKVLLLNDLHRLNNKKKTTHFKPGNIKCCVGSLAECGPRCTGRCSKTAFKKPCMFFCQKCCAKCLCVPAGTYGNKQSCPCYNNWKTKRGGPKCPWRPHRLSLSLFYLNVASSVHLYCSNRVSTKIAINLSPIKNV
jgi:hypothetical protein